MPPHSSHILQPLDLSVFKSLKNTWDQRLAVYARQTKGKKLEKKKMATVVSEIWTNMDPQIIINGFRKAGIYPINKHIFPRENV